jgi:hypothetical protein
MHSEQSYLKFQKLYDIVLPVAGMTCLFHWDGATEIKIVLAIILLRVCYGWSEMAALEQGTNRHFRNASNQSAEGANQAAFQNEDNATETDSWACFIGLLLQITMTLVVSLMLAWLIRSI